MNSYMNYFITIRDRLHSRGKYNHEYDSDRYDLLNAQRSPLMEGLSHCNNDWKPKLVANSTIPQLASNNARAQGLGVDPRRSFRKPSSVLSKFVVIPKFYPDGSSSLIKRGKFKGLYDQRPSSCPFIQEHTASKCPFRKCYCMRRPIVPSPLRQCSSTLDDFESHHTFDGDIQVSWNLKENRLLTRMRLKLTESRIIGKEGHRIRRRLLDHDGQVNPEKSSDSLLSIAEVKEPPIYNQEDIRTSSTLVKFIPQCGSCPITA